MIKNIHIQPRCTGKTQQAVEKFLENPSNSLLIVKNNLTKHSLIDKYCLKKYEKNIIADSNNLHNSYAKYVRGDVENIIIDEYLQYGYIGINNIQYFVNLVNPIELNIYSTPSEQYDTDIFELVKNARKYGKPISSFRDNSELHEIYCDKSVAEYMMLLKNYITDPDSNIYVQQYGDYDEDYRDKFYHYRNEMGNKFFEIEFECKYLHKFKWIKQITADKINSEIVKTSKIKIEITEFR
jgi:hypothetical protein